MRPVCRGGARSARIVRHVATSMLMTTRSLLVLSVSTFALSPFVARAMPRADSLSRANRGFVSGVCPLLRPFPCRTVWSTDPFSCLPSNRARGSRVASSRPARLQSSQTRIRSGVGSVYLDYDGTISKESTVPMQLAAITEAAAHQATRECTVMREERSELISKISSEYSAAYKATLAECFQFKTAGRIDYWEIIRGVNEKMAQFEREWNQIVEHAQILSGARREAFLGVAHETPIDSSCIAFLEKCAERGIPVRIVSVNWSADWIRQSLADQSSKLKSVLEQGTLIQIYANELEYHNGISSGRLIKNVECGKDKGLLMKSLLEEHSQQTPSIFVGDALMDMEPLLLADIGIVLGADKTLTHFMGRLSIHPKLLVTHQLEREMTQHLHNGTSKAASLLRARDWKQISHFVFDEEKTTPRVLIVAGSDSGGGAGIQADLKTCLATGSFGTTAITAITSQNTFGVQAVHSIPIEHIESQMDSVLSDIGTDVVKTGMLPSIEVVEAVVRKLKQYDIPSLVVDPVLVSTSGDPLASEQVAQCIIDELLPLATVVCPNIPEAEVLTGLRIQSLDHMKTACLLLHKMGPQIVFLKGGHLRDTADVVDVLYDGENFEVLRHPWVETDRLHGTGCTLASAIASKLAQGLHYTEAVQEAVHYVEASLEQSMDMDIGQGTQLPFDHGYRWHQRPIRASFRSRLDLSLYAITDQKCNEKHNRGFVEAIKAAISGGVSVVQIREKETDSRGFLEHVQAAMEATEGLGIPVIVNDRVDVALAANADGVHLGQEDLPIESIRRLLGPDKILGVSVKTVEQAIAAQNAGADYLGVGAVFPTMSKSSSVIGLERLREIRDAVQIPIVAIGGVTQDNASVAIEAGAAGVAVISAIFDASDPTAAAETLYQRVHSAFPVERRRLTV